MTNVQNALNAQSARILRRLCDLTLTEWRILLLLSRPDIDYMADITRLTGLDKGQISRGAKSLAVKGYITIMADADDRRAQLLRTTSKGEAVRTRVLPHMQRRQARLIEHIAPEDLTAFERVLGALGTAAREEE